MIMANSTAHLSPSRNQLQIPVVISNCMQILIHNTIVYALRHNWYTLQDCWYIKTAILTNKEDYEKWHNLNIHNSIDLSWPHVQVWQMEGDIHTCISGFINEFKKIIDKANLVAKKHWFLASHVITNISSVESVHTLL